MAEDTKVWVDQYISYIDGTNETRPLNERDRDYVDHKQWTTDEARVLLGRKQAAVVMNRIKPKVDFLLGLERQQRTDPRAYPRTPEHSDDAEAVTDALRFVADNNDFDQLASDVFDELLVEGTGAGIIEVEKNGNDEFEIILRQVDFDRFYYDLHSRRKNFSDIGFGGISTWLDLAEAKKMFEGHDEDLDALSQNITLSDVHEDRPKWIDKKGKRVRVNEHYFKKDGIWNLVFFTEGLELRKAAPAPMKDEFGEPEFPIEAVSAYIDRNNARYGAVRGLIHPQDEINHRRSKALHMLSNIRVVSDPGVVEDTADALNKLASGKAWIEKETQGEVNLLDNTELSQGQLAMLQEAKSEIDAQGANAALTGNDPRTQSGRALEARQAGGVVELGPLFDLHRAWKRRVYRQIWHRIKQFWDEEKWIRVTDDEKNTKFVALNQPLTDRDRFAEELGVQPDQVEQALQEMGATVLPGALDQPAGIKANVAEMDVDIIVAESPDTINIQQEQFAEIVNLAGVYGPQFVPFDAVLELSSLRNKDEIIERLRGESPEAAEAVQAEQAKQDQTEALEADATQSKANRDKAAAAKDIATAQQIQQETALGGNNL